MDTLTVPNDILPNLINKLTPRQLEIIGHLAAGHSRKQVARIMNVGESSIRNHVVSACRKTGIENRVQLIVLYAQWWATERKEK